MAGPGVRHPLRWGLALAALVVVLDQVTKYAVFAGLRPPLGGLEVTSFFNIVTTWNRGVSFGLFASGSAWTPILLTGLALVVAAALAWWLRRAENRVVVVALGLIIGGALGNAIDRALYGAVMDFLDFHWAGWHWPAFNVADSGITVGAALLVWDALFGGAQSPRTPGR